MIRQIPLTQGKFAIVDTDDYQRVSKFKWTLLSSRLHNKLYAYRTIYNKGKQTHLSLHRFIMNAQKGDRIDHKNGNGLDNTKCNLRFCTQQENVRNSIKRRSDIASSIYKGITWDKARGKWSCRIRDKSGKKIYLGRFDSEVEAAKIYNEAAIKYHGEFSRLNIIGEGCL